MEILKTTPELQNFRENIDSTQSLGFVPTMGALHKGHLSLVNIASQQTDIVIVSIFVNPTQFNDPEDLKKYPRDTVSDLRILSKSKAGAVFLPEVSDIYPEPDHRQFDFGHLGKVMEGAHRPGHFNGVAQVVSRLFDLVKPDKAFFGLKDFQQLAIVKKLVKMMNYQTEIISCPIIREMDGLAMSSRNALLNPEEREAAPEISKVLLKAVEKKGSFSVSELKKWVIDTLNHNPLMEVEYFEIVDSAELTNIQSWNDAGDKIGCIAIKLGKIRLIDNINFS